MQVVRFDGLYFDGLLSWAYFLDFTAHYLLFGSHLRRGVADIGFVVKVVGVRLVDCVLGIGLFVVDCLHAITLIGLPRQ